jgi:hypothetical protein
MQVHAAKFLLEDGSIINGIPICVTTLYSDLIVIDHDLWTEGSTIIYSDSAWRIIKNNLSGTTAPTANDDETEGYSANSLWFDLNATPDEIYRCMDATEGAAIWKNTSLEISELGTAALLNASTDGTLAGNSDTELPTEKAVKTYADTKTTLAAVKADVDVSDAISKKHSQNTDTGTTSTAFQIDSSNTGPKIKNNSGVVEARNAADNAYADFKAKDVVFNKITGGTISGSLVDTLAVATTSGMLTVAQISNILITNTGQTAAGVNVSRAFPAGSTANGAVGACVLTETVAKSVTFTPASGETFYLDGSALAADQGITLASAVKGAELYWRCVGNTYFFSSSVGAWGGV